MAWAGAILQGYELMEQAWHAYRKRYAKLDTYLREWLYDFMIVHGLDMPIRETYQRFPRVLSSELKEKEWKRRFTLQPVELTWELRSICWIMRWRRAVLPGEWPQGLGTVCPEGDCARGQLLSQNEGGASFSHGPGR